MLYEASQVHSQLNTLTYDGKKCIFIFLFNYRRNRRQNVNVFKKIEDLFFINTFYSVHVAIVSHNSTKRLTCMYKIIYFYSMCFISFCA